MNDTANTNTMTRSNRLRLWMNPTMSTVGHGLRVRAVPIRAATLENRWNSAASVAGSPGAATDRMVPFGTDGLVNVGRHGPPPRARPFSRADALRLGGARPRPAARRRPRRPWPPPRHRSTYGRPGVGAGTPGSSPRRPAAHHDR